MASALSFLSHMHFVGLDFQVSVKLDRITECLQSAFVKYRRISDRDCCGIRNMLKVERMRMTFAITRLPCHTKVIGFHMY